MESLTQPFVQLKELKVASVCSNSTLIFLLMLAPGLVIIIILQIIIILMITIIGLTRLFIGGRHNISNETLIKVKDPLESTCLWNENLVSKMEYTNHKYPT